MKIIAYYYFLCIVDQRWFGLFGEEIVNNKIYIAKTF